MDKPEYLPDKFWQHVTYRPETGCWVWSGPTGGVSGYPTFKRRAAWKAAYELMYGPIPKWGIYQTVESCVGADFCANPDHRLSLPIDQYQVRHRCQCGDWHDPDIEQ